MPSGSPRRWLQPKSTRDPRDFTLTHKNLDKKPGCATSLRRAVVSIKHLMCHVTSVNATGKLRLRLQPMNNWVDASNKAPGTQLNIDVNKMMTFSWQSSILRKHKLYSRKTNLDQQLVFILMLFDIFLVTNIKLWLYLFECA